MPSRCVFVVVNLTMPLYDLMDSAYDMQEIWDESRAHKRTFIVSDKRSLGHVPIIDPNPLRGGKAAAEALAKRRVGFKLAEDIRYNERSGGERVNGAFKDSYGGRFVRVRGHAKVLCHFMFGILTLTAEQIMRLIA